MDNEWDGVERRASTTTKEDMILLGQAELKKSIEVFGTKIEEIHNAIYVGNGKPCIMIRINTLETCVKYIYGLIILIVSGLIGIFIKGGGIK